MNGSSLRRVLFIIPTLTGGGAERVIVTLLRHLDRSKFQLTLAVVDMREAVFREDLPEDVEFIDLGCSRVRYALPKLIRLIWRRRPDVVFSTLGHLNLALAILRPCLPDGVRYLARETTIVSRKIENSSPQSFWRWAYRRFYSSFDAVICQSQTMRNDLIANFKLSPHKAVLIHNPLDVERIRLLAMQPVVTGITEDKDEKGKSFIHLVAAGRLSYEKGFDLLIEALSLCNDSCLRLTLIGEGILHAELERLVREKGLSRQVRFAGFQKNPYPFLAQADAFVLSSRYEGFPNVVLEALACGTPVIATPVQGVSKEILDGIAGCVIADDTTPEGLARALSGMVFGKRIPVEVVERYSVAGIIKLYAAELLGNASV